ncbi:hypothetical protein FHS89_002241 [Rubricella aquisinus]|uniref:Peptidase M23 n=1 Tax=Rubricella aquisinus TaxID=2028108 RepID=A0A840X2Y2_9RHOB|nr:hypothetical protein [Rubricella aquisinus]MBB5516215.1 hypothetical protein [Rubricella aquisinus]
MRITIGLILMTGAAQAHSGAHMHPHGAEFGIGAMALALLVGAGVGAAIMARVKK